MSLKSALLGAAAAIAVGASADAAQNGWYASLEGGAAWVDDLSGVEACGGCLTTRAHFEISTDAGWAVLASIGYEWDHWRFEGEAGYRQNSMNRIAWTTGFPGFSSNLDDLSQLTLMANMLYDIPLGDRFSVSVGAGVGFDRIDFKWPGFGANGWSDDDWQFAWQGIVGLNYEISPEWNVFVDYRYLNAGGPDFTKNAGTNYALHFDDIDTQTVSAGLRWHFSS